jgi:hypothetical protein
MKHVLDKTPSFNLHKIGPQIDHARIMDRLYMQIGPRPLLPTAGILVVEHCLWHFKYWQQATLCEIDPKDIEIYIAGFPREDLDRRQSHISEKHSLRAERHLIDYYVTLGLLQDLDHPEQPEQMPPEQ